MGELDYTQMLMVQLSEASTDERERKLYLDLVKYVRFLVGVYGVRDHWMLNPDDLTGDCYLALARCWRRYSGRLDSTLTYDALLAVCKTSIKNRIRTLLYKAFLVPGRKAEYQGDSLDDDEAGIEIEAEGVDPSKLYDSAERVAALVERLSAMQLRVLDAVLGGNERVQMYIRASSNRRTWVHKSPMVSITPLVVARALCEDVGTIEAEFRSIRSIWSEVVK